MFFCVLYVMRDISWFIKVKNCVNVVREREEFHLFTFWVINLLNLFVLFQTTRRTVPFLFVRGDGVILVSPPLRTA